MISVVAYENYRSLLRDLFQERTARNRTLSLRGFAQLIGMSPSHLSRTFRGEKQISLDCAHRISKSLYFSPEETEHFLSLVRMETEKSPVRRNALRRAILQREKGRQVISPDQMRVVADWYHFAILSLANTRGFQADPNWIARRLGIKPFEARLALERLLTVGLMVKSARGLRPARDGEVTTTDDIPSGAIQENHRQQLKRAAEALTSLPIDLREFGNITLAINPEDMPEAKQMIRSFMDRFSSSLEKKPARELFQLNVQFYQLTHHEDYH